jgi:hypothetical protein
MNSLLRRLFTNAIKLKTENDFQEFVEFLFSTAYERTFTTVKQKVDKGSDGILDGDTSLAVYGPSSYTLQGFKKKIGDDYESYSHNWKTTHPNWMVVYNDQFKANMIQFVDSKHAGARKIGLTELVQIIEDLPWSKIKRIGNYLEIPSELLVNDIISQVIDDLIRRDESGFANSKRPNAIYIEDKIVLNYASEDVKQATENYYERLEFFDATEGILREHTSMEVAALRGRIRDDFNALGGSFIERFHGLIECYGHSHAEDDQYRFALTVLLTFFFEQCLIGAKAEGELTC